MAEGTGRGDSLSIWFFVGVMTLLYGIVLLPYGLYHWHTPPENEVKLGWLVHYHSTFWWGLFLTVFGAFYTLKYRPRPGDENRI